MNNFFKTGDIFININEIAVIKSNRGEARFNDYTELILTSGDTIKLENLDDINFLNGLSNLFNDYNMINISPNLNNPSIIYISLNHLTFFNSNGYIKFKGGSIQLQHLNENERSESIKLILLGNKNN